MKCKSCLLDIDPKWKHAIEKNVCPFCGEDILDQKLVDCFSNLTIIFNDNFSFFEEEILEWLRARLNMMIISKEEYDSLKTVKTFEKREIVSEIKDGKEILEKFSKRTDHKGIFEKQAHLKSIMNKIKQGGAESILLNEDGTSKEAYIKADDINKLITEQKEDEDSYEDETSDDMLALHKKAMSRARR